MSSPPLMSALRTTAPGVLELVRVPHPRLLAADDVLLRPLLVGICGTDVEIASGHMAYFSSGAARYPVTLGHEWVAEVVSCGQSVTTLTPGDRVVGECSLGCAACAVCVSGDYHRCAHRRETGIMNCDGGAAELLVMPARALHRVSPSLSLRAAALIEPTAVAFRGVTLAGVTTGSVVAVLGDGPIGLLLLQVALAHGATRVIVVGGDAARLALATRLGAHAVIDVRHAEGGVPAAIHRACGGMPPSILLEASGNVDAVHAAIAAAGAGAVIVIQGLCGSGRGPQARGVDLDRLVVQDLTLRGALGSPGVWPAVIALVESGAIDPAALVTHELPLTDFAHAFELVKSRASIKLLLRCNGGSA